jgi:hypothetical protein
MQVKNLAMISTDQPKDPKDLEDLVVDNQVLGLSSMSVIFLNLFLGEDSRAVDLEDLVGEKLELTLRYE